MKARQAMSLLLPAAVSSGCQGIPKQFQVSFEAGRAENPEPFDRLVSCLGLDPLATEKRTVGGSLTRAEAWAVAQLFEKVNRGETLAQTDLEGVSCRDAV